jgi:hypothetical protein
MIKLWNNQWLEDQLSENNTYFHLCSSYITFNYNKDRVLLALFLIITPLTWILVGITPSLMHFWLIQYAVKSLVGLLITPTKQSVLEIFATPTCVLLGSCSSIVSWLYILDGAVFEVLPEGLYFSSVVLQSQSLYWNSNLVILPSVVLYRK